jgi:hypothetical protein
VNDAQLMDELREAARQHYSWMPLAVPLDDPVLSVHLVEMADLNFTYVLDGKKTIEGRFSKNPVAPYQRVAIGDLVFIRNMWVHASFRVASMECLRYLSEELDGIRREHGPAMCVEDDRYWEAQAERRYATFVGIDDVRQLRPAHRLVGRSPLNRGWVVLRSCSRMDMDGQMSLL